MSANESENWMRTALEAARKGWGRCVPNPMVGAVIVRDGVMLASGYHQRAGEGHSEVNALANLPAGTNARGATVYVTLEPCSTYGRTPPCCDALIKAGVAKVVIGCLDANPSHAGAAVARLTEAGIQVEHGILEDECRRLNEHFFWWITRKRPWVILKMGMTLDGRIALPDGTSKWITGSASRMRVQELRKLADMIMVGGRTALCDNPGLKVTEEGWRRQPIPAIWTSKEVPAELRLMQESGERPLITARPSTREEWLTHLETWCRDLGVAVLLLEGGGELAANALQCGIVNQIQFFIAPKILCGRDSAPVVGGAAPAMLSDALRLKDVRTEMLDGDLLYTAYPENPDTF
ncbi:MAG: bifunctional diaminohydroxyphosphoribosylaminopyrimidine deaminase/5-amino-6-(5-phosphoribosylamino)uracil reductase RibD [Victivallales bacterium]|nr:bifunctional diaminohydroxyphosphoribosylaminopyrimidine deaminase/5-amino-6-(5-phosphoribosylamino)uracil reductase RibD [Victivallales bacterium]